MIVVDSKEEVSSGGFVSRIRRKGVLSDKMPLDYGDFAFEGKGPEGNIAIGIERKTLSNMLGCIDDSQYTGHQLIGMSKVYAKSFLIVEGVWRPHDQDGTLMEEYISNGKVSWGPTRFRSQRTLYSKLYRYLISVSMAGVIVTYSRNEDHTAQNLVELFHYFQKKWEDHTSLLEVQKLNLPSLSGRPSLTRRWAADLEGIGVKNSIEAERVFKTPIRLATSDEMDWLGIKGIGVPTAQKIIREIHGVVR